MVPKEVNRTVGKSFVPPFYKGQRSRGMATHIIGVGNDVMLQIFVYPYTTN